MKLVLRFLLGAVAIVGIVNFVALIVISTALGGDAVNGHAANGHYFLSSHGNLREVTENLFNFSLWQTRSVFVTQPAMMLAGFLMQHFGLVRAR